MTGTTIAKLWSGYRFNNYDNCNNEDCKGRLDYDNGLKVSVAGVLAHT